MFTLDESVVVSDKRSLLDGGRNYRRLFDSLADSGITRHLVLEQAVEDRSPNQLSVVEAHRQSRGNLMKASA